MTEGRTGNDLAPQRGAGGLTYQYLVRALRLPEMGLMMRLMSDTLSRPRP
jgi:hypothetical protein